MMRMTARGGLAATIGILCASAAQAVPPEFQAKVNAYVEESYPDDAPGAAVIVVEDGKVVYSGARGLADLETKRKITLDTVFRMASLTKQFTASVILQLERERKLSLTDPVSKFLPNYPRPGADATVAQLLNHTSGIKNYTAMKSWMLSGGRSKPVTTEQLIDVFKNEPVDFAPGTNHQYSNSGYVLLGAIIEKVTGRPWHEAVEERVSRPMQLPTIRYGVEETSTPAMARGYATKGGKTVPALALHMSNPHAAGSLIGSITDFAKWNEALHKGKVLRAVEHARMIAPAQLADGTVAQYGYGIGLGILKGRKTLLHSGDTAGFSTSTIYLPNEDLFVAIFTNSNDPAVPPKVARMKIAAMAIGDPYPELRKVAVPAVQVEPLLGVYSLNEGERRFFRKGDRLFTRRSGSSDQEVFAAGGDRFFYGPTTLTWFAVERATAGKHVMTTYHGAEQTPERSVRIGPMPKETAVNVPGSILQRYAGSYETTAGAPVIVAIGVDGTLTFQVGKEPMPLRALSENQFRLDAMGSTVTFHTKDGVASGFTSRRGNRTIEATRVPR